MTDFPYTLRDSVAVLSMARGENRFNPAFLKGFLKALDQIEKEQAASCLIVRSAHDKIFSNGIDLDWLVPVLRSNDVKTAKHFFYEINRLLQRILLYPMPTIAAINGHAFAGGAILSCAFDFRFMRYDRGFFCLPEVDLGIPFLPGMNALLKKAVPMHKLLEMQLAGSRLTAYDCQEHHIVVKACHVNQLMDEALSFAAQFKKERAIVAELKTRLHADIVHAMTASDKAYIESGTFNI